MRHRHYLSAGIYSGIFRILLPLAVLVVFMLSAGAGDSAWAGMKTFDRDRIMSLIHEKGYARIIVQFDSPEIKEALSRVASYRNEMDMDGTAGSMTADVSFSHRIGNMSRSIILGIGHTRHKVNHTYSYLPAIAMEISEETLEMLESMGGVVGIFEDRPYGLPPYRRADNPNKATGASGTGEKAGKPLNFPQNPDTIGVGAAWASGFTGTGQYVAVLDTGTRITHEAFAGKSIVEACFSLAKNCPNGNTTMYGSGASAPYESIYSGYEHGTHVAATAVGNSASSSGVAKGANLISVQVFSKFTTQDCSDNGPCIQTFNADQLAALDYIYSLRNTYKIAAVNMSLGASQYTSQSLCDSENAVKKVAIDNLRNVGIATVIASGNDETCDRIEAPACISSAIAVGAVDSEDREVAFNDWHYSMLDLLAPGNNIYSASPDSDTSYTNLNGTSMATPHAAGAWAIMKQQNPSASVTDIYYTLASTGIPVRTVCSNIYDIKPRIQIDAALSNPMIPVPSTRGDWMSYSPTASPVLNFTQAFIPLGIGPAAGSNPVLNLRIGFARFNGPVNIYFGFQSNAVDPNTVFVLKSDNTFQPVSAGLVPWKSSVRGPFDQSLLGEFSLLDLPPGVYNLYVAVSPASHFNSYYLWTTSFTR